MSYTGRLIAGTIGVLLTTLIVLVFGVDRALRLDLESGIRAALERRAHLLHQVIGDSSGVDQARVRELARVADARVTLIDPNGVVLADSEVEAEQLPRVENHANRPEVQEAMASGTGAAIRTSRTVGRPLMYVAIRGGPAVIRLATPLDAVTATVREAQRALMLGSLVALVLGVGLAVMAGRRLARPLAEARGAARAIAQGEAPRFPWSGIPDVDRLVLDLRDMHRQLTERYEALRQKQAETSALVDAMVEGVVSADAKGNIIGANPAARRLLGFGEDDQLPALPLLFRSREAREAVQSVLAGGAVPEREIEVGDRICLLTARATATGGVVVVLHDLTRLKRLEAVRRDFVANVSHELKTPLTAISGYAETLLTDRVDDTTMRRFVETILANARRMQRLVDDQLDLSRIESGTWSPRPETIEVEAIAREAWSLVAPVRRQTASLHVDLDPAARTLTADPDGVRQILRNLFENAIRHTSPDGEVRVRTAIEAGGVRLSVSDTGSGIPSEHLPRIFERFYRVDAARSREQGGTGLGLAIVRHLMEAHDGKVRAESDLGRGTTIHCWFPAQADVT
ncbi:MAG: ATP-binding protein [Gemmatimonadales bacterium]